VPRPLNLHIVTGQTWICSNETKEKDKPSQIWRGSGERTKEGRDGSSMMELSGSHWPL
jgi:hypothetical protein